MNKNGVKKLLAAIAVFAMVFALASVVVNTAAVEDSEAAVPTDNISGTLTELKQESATNIDAGKYYISGNITNATSSASVEIYLVDGASISFGTISGTVTVYLAVDGGASVAPTKAVSNVKYTAETNGSAKVTNIYGDLSLEVITETGTNASADFKMTVTVTETSAKAYYLFSKVASVNLPKDTTGSTYVIDHAGSLENAKVTVNQIDAGVVKNSVEAVPETTAGSLTVTDSYVDDPQKYTMAVSAISNNSKFTVLEGSVIIADKESDGSTLVSTEGVKSSAVTATAGNTVWFASLEDLAVRNVLPVANYTVIGSQTIEGTITLPASASVVLEAATDVLTVKGALNNLGTISGTSGKLVNYGTINNGQESSEGVDAASGSISVKYFDNGKNHTGTVAAGDYVPAISGTFNNYYRSTITSSTVLNSEGSVFVNKAGILSAPIVMKTINNYGSFTNEGYMSIQGSNTFTNCAELNNKGTLNVNGTLRGAVGSVSSADDLTKLVESKMINTGSIVVGNSGLVAIFIDNGDSEGDVSFNGNGKMKDGFYVAKKTEGSVVEYAFWGDEYVLTLSASTVTAGDKIETGYMVDADGYIEVVANTTKSQFHLTAYGDLVTYATVSILQAGNANASDNASQDMYASSVKVVSLGEDLTIPDKKSVELITQTLTKNINLSGVAIIPSDSTITFADGGRILLAAGSILNVYGDLVNRNVDSKIDISFPATVGSETIVYSPNADISAFIVVPEGVANAKFINNTGVTIAESTAVGDDVSVILSSAINLKTIIEQAKVIYIRGAVVFSSTMFKDGLDLSDKTIMFATAGSTLELTGINVYGGDFAGYVAPGAAEGAAPVVGTIVIKQTGSGETLVKSASFDGTVFSNVVIKTTAGTDATTVSVAFVGVTAEAVTISYGSFIINGTLDLDAPADVAAIQSAVADGQVVILQDVTITGSGTLDISKLEIAGEVVVGEDVVIDVKTGYKLKVDSTAVISGAGEINVKDAAGLTIETGADVTEGIIIAVGDLKTYVSNQAELVAKYDIYNIFIINADGFELTDSVAEALTIGKKTIVLNGHDLTIIGEVIFDETTIEGDDDSKLIVATGNAASLTLNKANVYATVEDKDENITIKSALVSGWDTDSADTIKVGYGNTLNMKSVNIVSGKVITVYGILNIEGTTTVNPGASVIIKDGAVANNSGTLTILGKETEGSVVVEGALNNTGSIVVGDNNGSATMAVSGNVILKDGSSLNVKVAKSADKLDDNYLAGTGAVTVDAGATLTVNGTISVSSVYLKGTLGMNGIAAGTTVYLYDGVSVAVTSVTGSITFSDKYVVDEDVLKDDGTQKGNVIYSDGNQITLTNVKGVVVSESVKAGSVKIEEDNYKTYVCGMTVSGVVSAIKDADGSIVIDESAEMHGLGIPGVSNYVSIGKVTVGDMALGKKVTLTTNGKVTVSGNLTAVEEDAEIFIGNTPDDMVTVTGLITCLDFELDGNLSAAMYSIHDTEKATETYYYTTFVAAVDAAPTAYENTVVLYGKITISEGITIAKPIIIELDSSAKVTIKGTADVIIDNGAKLDGSAGEITVTGTLKIVDKDSGIIEPVKEKFNYEVLLTDDADKQVIIYAGLIGVLKNAEAGQTVTMQKSAKITEDIEIKAGVTLVVPEKLTLFIGDKKDDVTVTVNGTITVEKRAYVVPAENAKKVTIITNGVISSANSEEFEDFETLGAEKFVMTDYASFDIDQKVYYWSNLAYAAENCHEGDIVLQGQLTAGDIVFTEDEKATEELVVWVITPEGAKVNTNVYATSITLDGASLIVDQKSKVSATVKGASLSGDASVILEGVSFIGIESVYDEVKEENHLYIAGAPTGTITIAAGNVEVADAFAVYATEDRSIEFTVADGAILTVPKDAEFASANVEDSDVLIVEGTLAVKNGGEAYIANMYLAGTMTVESKVVYIANSTIAGTLDVKEKTETTEEGLVYLEMVFVGDEPKSLGANGTVIGNVKVLDGDWFYVFNGSDVSKAKINYNLAEQKNDIKTTVVNINGDDVVTIYAFGSVDVYDALDAAEIELIGLETPAFDSTTKMYSAPTLKTEDLISDAANVKVGKYTNVYLDFALVGIHGMISQGQGVILMIDGNTIDNYRATLLGGDYVLSVGTYKVTYEPAYGYEDKGIKITFNGSVVTDGKITVTADMKTFTLTVSDATPADPVTPITPVDPSQPEKDDGMGITEYLLIVLVILAAILVVVVAIRMMRS